VVIVALPSPSAGSAGADEAGAGVDTVAGIGTAAGRVDQTAVCLGDWGCSKRMWKKASMPSGM